jgi:hypothetical protein
LELPTDSSTPTRRSASGTSGSTASSRHVTVMQPGRNAEATRRPLPARRSKTGSSSSWRIRLGNSGSGRSAIPGDSWRKPSGLQRAPSCPPRRALPSANAPAAIR